MMNKQGGRQHIVAVRQNLGERIELEKLRARHPGLASDILRVLNCYRTDVAAMRLDCNAVPRGEPRNADQYIATASCNIENSQRPALIPDNSCFADPAP